jgi:hypothetical protein
MPSPAKRADGEPVSRGAHEVALRVRRHCAQRTKVSVYSGVPRGCLTLPYNEVVADKKRIERLYLEEARPASTVFPSGDPVPHDPLDFLFGSAGKTLGIEMTELCREDERREGARLGYVAPLAKRLYSKLPGANPVNVSPVFSLDADEFGVKELATGLAEFVYQHQEINRNLDWYECREAMPKGFFSIGVFPSTDDFPDQSWRYFRSSSTELATQEMIAAVIAEKNARLPEYRKIAGEVWLLIVNDLFLGPGEVCARTDYLAEWTFNFDFDRVLLFSRQPGGSGEVVELRQH